MSFYGTASDEIAVVTGPHKFRFYTMSTNTFTSASEDGVKE
jgi:hypothetical protein